MDLKDKVAIITGGSKGIGKAIAIELSKEGVHTALIARNANALEETISEIKSLSNTKPIYVSADICNLNDVRRIVSVVKNTYGHIDILVNNAGVYTLNFIKDIPAEKLAQILDTNLRGTVLLTKEVLSIFDEQNEGSIIDICSTAALNILDQNNSYAAAKPGQRVFSQIVQLEYPYIKVYRIHPSNTKTEGRQTVSSELEERIRKEGHFLQASEIGIETVKLLKGQYPPNVNEILIESDEFGNKMVRSVTVRLEIEYKTL